MSQRLRWNVQRPSAERVRLSRARRRARAGRRRRLHSHVSQALTRARPNQRTGEFTPRVLARNSLTAFVAATVAASLYATCTPRSVHSSFVLNGMPVFPLTNPRSSSTTRQTVSMEIWSRNRLDDFRRLSQRMSPTVGPEIITKAGRFDHKPLAAPAPS